MGGRVDQYGPFEHCSGGLGVQHIKKLDKSVTFSVHFEINYYLISNLTVLFCRSVEEMGPRIRGRGMEKVKSFKMAAFAF